VQHGFPNKPTAMAWDPALRILAIGTATGSVKVYPLVIISYWKVYHLDRVFVASWKIIFERFFHLCDFHNWICLLYLLISLTFMFCAVLDVKILSLFSRNSNAAWQCKKLQIWFLKSHNKTQRDALFLIFIWYSILHVSDKSTFHHQEYLNVYM
jgi:hypothetical protein